MSQPSVDTKAVQRRQLHFDTIADIQAEVERLAHARELKALGNWTPGQNFEHLARVMDGSIDGFNFKMPWIVRTLLGWIFKTHFLNNPMPAGFKLSKQSADALLPGDVSTEQGLRRILIALGRLQAETKRVDSPFLGKMSEEDWVKLQCRHCELHLSFIVPVE